MTASALAAAPLEEQAKLIKLESSRAPAARFMAHVGHEDAEVRARTAHALGRLRTAAALGALQRLSADGSAEVRRAAAFALSQTPGSGPFARQRLSVEPDSEIRGELYFAIGLRGTAAEVGVLVEALSQPVGPDLKAAELAMAAQALGRMSVRGIWQATGQIQVQRLAQQRRRLEVEIRRGAAFSLGQIKPQTPSATTAQEIIEAARDEADATAQAWFVRATGGLKGVQGDLAELYAETATDPAPGVRIATARAGAQAGWTGVRFLLSDPDPEVRLAAINAVGKVKALDSAELLGPIVLAGAKLKPPSEDGAAMPPQLAEAAAALRALNRTDIWAETETARYSRVKVGLAPSLSQYLSPDYCPHIRMAAASIDPNLQRLMKLMAEDSSAAVRIAATERVLDRVGGTQRAIQLLSSPNDTVKVAAAEWLANKPAAMAEPRLLQLVRVSDSVDVVRAATTALGRMYSVQKRTSPAAKALVPGLLKHEAASIQGAGRGLARALGMPESADDALNASDALAKLQTIRGARLQTVLGTVVIQLYPEEAPLAVQNFARLADDGFFDGLNFHRVVPDFVVQGGDPRGDGWGGPGYTVPDEINPHRHVAGAVGMAHTGKDTAGSQWYATISAQPHLDGKYTVFGQVTHGIQVLRSMLPGDRIESVTIERIPTHSERLSTEQARAKETLEELARHVKPRKKSAKAQRLLAKHYGVDKAEPEQAEPEEAAPEAEAPQEPAQTPQGEQATEADADKAPAERESLPAEDGALPESHEKKETEGPIKEGEKVEFEADTEEE